MAVGNAFANFFWFAVFGGLVVSPAIALLTNILSRDRFRKSRALLAGVVSFLLTDYLHGGTDLFVDLYIDWELMIIEWEIGAMIFIGTLFGLFFLLPSWISVAISAKRNTPEGLTEPFE
ncbi:MAG: hypothetical protein AAGK17_06150 [Pseudomonadota bacterium]